MTEDDLSDLNSSTGPRIGAVCVLYGAPRIPGILRDLAQRGVDVVIVDNSDDLDPAEVAGNSLRVVRPGRNLGYSRGVNAGVEAMPIRPDALLIVNPDIVGDPDALLDFARTVAASPEPLLAAPAGGDGHFGYLPTAPPWLIVGQYVLRSSWHPRPKEEDDMFLSGALLGLNRAALDRVAPDNALLDPTLFFMDDVELTDRARRLGCRVAEIGPVGDLDHEGGTSMRRRPAVRIYFSRISKVRYWQGRSPVIGAMMRGFFLAETSVGQLVSGRSAPDGSAGHGFAAARRWLRHPDPQIDEVVLGNDHA